MNPKRFVFDRIEIATDRRSTDFYYRTEFEDNDDIEFKESLEFNSRLPNSEVIENALHFYHVCAGISYYKAHLAPEIGSHGLDPWAAEAMSDIYLNGLGEFLYINQLDPDVVARFEPEQDQQLPTTDRSVTRDDWLVAIGGGKDSLTTATILDQLGQDYMTFVVNPKSWVKRQLQEIGAPDRLVERKIDSFLTSDQPQYQGHVPITVVVSAIAIIEAILAGTAAVVFSNESSADEPTVEDYQGMPINHQWAKSTEAERIIQRWISRYIANDIKYFSLLRQMSELEIAELFAKAALPRYSGLWSSSNSNFRQDASGKLDWDLTSPKTCTVFLLLTPFVERDELIEEFGGNPLALEENSENWAKLLGETDSKPFECVATIGEMRQAKYLAQKTGQWPELSNV